MKRIGVLTSGGDAPGMNAALRAVVRTAMHYDMSVVGIKRGYNGVLMKSEDPSDDYIELTRSSVGEIVHRGGTMLMTARCLEFKQRENQIKAIENLRSIGVEGLVTIGGDGTFTGAAKLAELGFPTVGIPGTIDNDLPFTDFTLGFDTALNTICDAVNHIRETNTSHERASLVEVMGRNCGDLATYAGLAVGAEMVMIPEAPWNIAAAVEKLRVARTKGKTNAILVVAEGAWESMQPFDIKAFCEQFGLPSYFAEGEMNTQKLCVILEKLSGQETRATVLGYIQRGGSPSANDRLLGCRMGERAVDLLRNNIGGRVIGIHNNAIIDVPIEEIKGKRRQANPEFMDLMNVLSL